MKIRTENLEPDTGYAPEGRQEQAGGRGWRNEDGREWRPGSRPPATWLKDEAEDRGSGRNQSECIRNEGIFGLGYRFRMKMRTSFRGFGSGRHCGAIPKGRARQVGTEARAGWATFTAGLPLGEKDEDKGPSRTGN